MSKAIVHRGCEPEICRDCKNYEFDDGPWGEVPDIAYCKRSLIFPKKDSCKYREQFNGKEMIIK